MAHTAIRTVPSVNTNLTAETASFNPILKRATMELSTIRAFTTVAIRTARVHLIVGTASFNRNSKNVSRR